MNKPTRQLVQYLSKEFDLSPRAISLALRRQRQADGPLPMILFQLGLINLMQLNQLMEWIWKN